MKLLPQTILLVLTPFVLMVGLLFYLTDGLLKQLDAYVLQHLQEKSISIKKDLDQTLLQTQQFAGILAKTEGLAEAIEINDVYLIMQRAQWFLNLGMSYISFFNTQNMVVARGHDEFHYGEAFQDPLVQQALTGKSFTTVIHFDNGVYLLSVVPVYKYEESIVGAIAVGIALDAQFLKELSERRDVEISVTLNNAQTVSSSINDFSEWDQYSFVYKSASTDLHEWPFRLSENNSANREALFQLRRQILLFTIIFSLLIITIAFALTRRMLQPMQRLVYEMRAYIKGKASLEELKNNISGISTQRNEIGQVATVFGKMSAQLVDSMNYISQINKAYERFVPHDFLDHLNKDSILEVTLGDCVACEMTILFSDIRSFTTISEGLNPEQTFRFVNSYLSRMGPVIRDHHGFIDKFIGDAIMALFVKAEDAVQAAIAMLRELEVYNEGRMRAGFEAINIGIGLNTGHLMLGTVGEHGRMEGTVISDAVNLASRIEGMTKMYGASLLISEFTFYAVGQHNKYNIRTIDRVKVKGKSEGTTIFEVLDGDKLEIKTKKQKINKPFEEALALYYLHEFQEAKSTFEKCANIYPEDKVVKIYLDRCEQGLSKDPCTKWDAVTQLDEK